MSADVRRTFDGLPRNFPEWMGWFRQHGIDPDAVDAHGWVERDLEHRRVHYLGLTVVEKFPNGAIEYARDGDELIRVPKSVQLEAKPLPFPA